MQNVISETLLNRHIELYLVTRDQPNFMENVAAVKS